MRFLTNALSAKRWLPVLALGLAMTVVAVDHADARRGGSFGFRGARTVQATPPTTTLPRTVAPIDRTNPGAMAASPAARTNMTRSGFFGGTLLGGLMFGGLIGLMMGAGIGGFFGFLGLLLQVGLVVLVLSLVAGVMRRRREPAYAGMPGDRNPDYHAGPAYRSPATGGGRSRLRPANARGPNDELGITGSDLDRFQAVLGEVQVAFGRGDRAALRSLATPQVMATFEAELDANAARGVRNEVRDVRLLQGDLAEAWREGGREYATVAMRYESIDATRDIASGRVVSGDAERLTEATELWTFVRDSGGDWRLTAIQEG